MEVLSVSSELKGKTVSFAGSVTSELFFMSILYNKTVIFFIKGGV